MFREAQETPRRIAEQFAANRNAVAELCDELRSRKPRIVVTCARGSSDHAATYAKYLFETRLGLMTASAAPSIASVYDAMPDLAGTLFLAISQSGRSPDLVASAEAARAAGAFVVALVNQSVSPLARAADRVIPLHAGPELSVAATKSCLAAFAAIAQIAATWKADSQLLEDLALLPEWLSQAWALDWSAAIEPLLHARGLYVIGRGLGLSAAQEAALKLKETCGLHAEAISAAEVRHGPLALVGPGFPVLLFSQSDRTRAGIVALADTLALQGAALIVAGFRHVSACNLAVLTASSALEPLLMLISFYRLANALAIARGFDPDSPPRLHKITETV